MNRLGAPKYTVNSGRPCVRMLTLCPSRALHQGRVDLKVAYVNKLDVIFFLSNSTRRP
jgi:hypothetical protein